MSKPVILVVEDEPDLIQVYNEFLCASFPEHEILCVSNVPTALSAVADMEQVNTVLAAALVDYSLGTSRGTDVIVALTAAYPGIPIFLLTGRATPEVAAQATELGATVIWKPVRMMALAKTLKDSL